MQITDQGLSADRYAVIPRTLTFLTRGEQILLLRGGPDKALWAGLLNGIGGHVEPGESIMDAARREVLEETRLTASRLTLRGLIHVTGQAGQRGVLVFVFLGEAADGPTVSSSEGQLEWHPLDALPACEMVEDLALLLPRILTGDSEGDIVYGLYTAGPDGAVSFRFGPPG